MSKHWKILSLLLLALIGVFAINASAAQANWLILLNKEMKTELKVVGESKETGFLLSEAGAKISCTKSEGEGTAKLAKENTLLGGSATIKFTGCKENKFPACEIHSEGQPVGTIVAKGEGDVEMEGSKDETIWITASSPNFTTIDYLGAKCPQNEAEEVVSGSVKLIVLEALKDLQVHEIHLEGLVIKLGESKAELHMLDKESKPLKLILGTLTDVDPTKTLAIHLCSLPGAPACP